MNGIRSDSCVGACPCRRTGFRFAGISAKAGGGNRQPRSPAQIPSLRKAPVRGRSPRSLRWRKFRLADAAYETNSCTRGGRVMPIPRLKDYQGPALFSYGFRPFFFFGSVYAGAIILVWLPVFYGHLRVLSVFAPRDWHVHEMLFGYIVSVVAGFLLTAVPNWTGRLPLQ